MDIYHVYSKYQNKNFVCGGRLTYYFGVIITDIAYIHCTCMYHIQWCTWDILCINGYWVFF